VTKREELEAALAKTEAARDRLEAALAKAKTALVNTVTDASKIDADQADASAKVEKARARCRQLRAALADPSQAEFITRSRERIGALARRPDEPAKREVSASPPAQALVEPPVRGGNGKAQDPSRRQKLIHRFDHVLAALPHARETIGLLALVIAYLQYYYFDVHLQIMSLPSVVAVVVLPLR
jgi:hypothetical protein